MMSEQIVSAGVFLPCYTFNCKHIVQLHRNNYKNNNNHVDAIELKFSRFHCYETIVSPSDGEQPNNNKIILHTYFCSNTLSAPCIFYNSLRMAIRCCSDKYRQSHIYILNTFVYHSG